MEELVAIHKKLDELYRRPESAQSQQELASQLKRAQESDAARTAELNDARAEIKRLRRELDASSSRIAQLQEEFNDARGEDGCSVARDELASQCPEQGLRADQV